MIFEIELRKLLNHLAFIHVHLVRHIRALPGVVIIILDFGF